METKNNLKVTIALIAAAALLALLPIFMFLANPTKHEFAGTDDGAETAVTELDPDYEPWFEPLIGELPGEIESGLFAFQAAVGSGIVFFCLGAYYGRRKAEKAGTAAQK